MTPSEEVVYKAWKQAHISSPGPTFSEIHKYLGRESRYDRILIKKLVERGLIVKQDRRYFSPDDTLIDSALNPAKLKELAKKDDNVHKALSILCNHPDWVDTFVVQIRSAKEFKEIMEEKALEANFWLTVLTNHNAVPFLEIEEPSNHNISFDKEES